MFNIEKYSKEDFKATYSPEDNKLRLYADVRIDQEDWEAMKRAGWKWAPKQELFVAYWSVTNEDFCLAIAGDIMPEEMTMVERAELKADRLLVLAQKRSDQCIGYQKAANDLMLRVGNNQPILGGHHSQRKAEKTQLQVDRSIDKAEETAGAVTYWIWRARGVIGHANYKNNSRTVYNRIKTLLKDLRTNQKSLNDAANSIGALTIVKNFKNEETKQKNILWACGGYSFYHLKLSAKIESGEITHNEALDQLIQACENTINNPNRARKISHILNRLAYEQDQLSLVPMFDGELTPAVIQTFLRTHGADKPKATKTDYGWLAVSNVCLPLHIGSSNELELEPLEWCELMQSVGYEVPTKKTVKSKAPILNFKTDKTVTWDRGYAPKQLKQVELTKDQHKRVGKDHTATLLSKCGLFRMRIGFVTVGRDQWGNPDHEWRTIFISDSKAHATPESMI